MAHLESDEIREMGLENAARPVRSVPHGSLAAKYTLQSLTYFLLNPNESRPSGRMPSLKLTPSEAADIAAYLLRGRKHASQPLATVAEQQLVDEGRRLFTDLRCTNCHDLQEAMPPRMATTLAQLDTDANQSCIASPQTGRPYYATSDKQTDALRSRLTELEDSVSNDQTASQASGLSDVAAELLCMSRAREARRSRAEASRILRDGWSCRPWRRRPSATTARWSRPEAHASVAQEGTRRQWRHSATHVRSNAEVRCGIYRSVPRFVCRSRFRCFASSREALPRHQRDLVESGRALLDLGCVQCHPMRGEHLPGVVGVDLAGIEDRIQPWWFREFLLNPAELKSRTRMPTFFPDGRSSVPTVLDGDVKRQVASIWAYLKDIDRQRLPERLATSKVHNFELVPNERPILLRTFMQGAGTHAIAVGFPQKVHLSFDAEAVRVAQAWRGRFVDAHGTWFDRFTPPAVPLGDDVVSFPAGVPFAFLTEAKESWPVAVGRRCGLSISWLPARSRNGVPTFLYRFSQFEIEDRFEPAAARQLTRKLQIRRPELNRRRANRMVSGKRRREFCGT